MIFLPPTTRKHVLWVKTICLGSFPLGVLPPVRLILWFGLTLFGMNAYASKDRGVFVGGGVNLINIGLVDAFDNGVNFKSGEVLVGYKHSKYLGIEVRGGASFQDEVLRIVDPDTGLRGAVKASIDQYYSVYYRAELANEIAKLYLLLGQTNLTTIVDFDNNIAPPAEQTESGFSYGLGFGLWLDERMNLNFEYKSIVSTSNDSFIGLGISADYRF